MYYYKLLMEKFIAPYLCKRSEYIGVELEYPLIFLDSKINTKQIILNLFKYLQENYGFENDKLDIDQNPISIKNNLGDKITLEGRYEIIEFAMQKDLSLSNIADKFFYYFEIVQNFLKKYDCFLTGMGTNLVDSCSKIHLLNSDFCKAIHSYIYKYTSYKNPNYFLTNMQSIQTHLEIPINRDEKTEGENLLKALNLFSKLDFARGTLFSNSLPNKTAIPSNISYPEDILCARDFNWAHSGFPDTGSVDAEFKSTTELIEYISKLKLYFKKTENSYESFKGPSIAEYFSDPSQKDDVLCVFRYLHNVVLNSYATLEIRSDCTQPLKDAFAPVAFNLGISRKINEATELTRRFFQDNNITYSNSTLRNMAINDIKITDDNTMRKFLQSLYNLAYDALKERGLSEEKHMRCLQGRIDKLECPAKYTKRQLEKGTSLYEIIEQCSEI